MNKLLIKISQYLLSKVDVNKIKHQNSWKHYLGELSYFKDNCNWTPSPTKFQIGDICKTKEDNDFAFMIKAGSHVEILDIDFLSDDYKYRVATTDQLKKFSYDMEDNLELVEPITNK